MINNQYTSSWTVGIDKKDELVPVGILSQFREFKVSKIGYTQTPIWKWVEDTFWEAAKYRECTLYVVDKVKFDLDDRGDGHYNGYDIVGGLIHAKSPVSATMAVRDIKRLEFGVVFNDLTTKGLVQMANKAMREKTQFIPILTDEDKDDSKYGVGGFFVVNEEDMFE